MDSKLLCPLCKEPIGTDRPSVQVGEKGCKTIRSANEHNPAKLTINAGELVHISCRKKFTRSVNDKKNSVCSNDKHKILLRSEAPNFDFKSRCLFCGVLAKCCLSSKKRSFDTYPVRSLEFQRTVINHCIQRGDQWADDVRRRLNHIFDLPAADAIYHQQCSVNFRTGKGIPKAYQTAKCVTPTMKSPGRPQDKEQTEAFVKVMQFLELTTSETLTVNDLVSEMFKVCGDKAYSTKHMKTKIIEHFGDNVVISSIDGRRDIVTLKSNAASIIHSFYTESQGQSDEEKKAKILETAAKLLQDDISSMKVSRDYYPDFNDISSKEKNISFLPNSLQLFLKVVVGQANDIKVASIGQSIIQSCRPRSVIAPLQLGLGVQLHHHFGSRFLIDHLNSLGFCCSYSEVQKYECNAAEALSTNIPCQDKNDPFLQFVADNVDHNTGTIDGHDTFHGMGIIASSTPGSEVALCVPRQDVSIDKLTERGTISVKYFVPSIESHEAAVFNDLPEITSCRQLQRPLDMFCKIIWPLRSHRPSWSGFMQTFDLNSDTFQKKSTVTFLPMINLNPSDVNCVDTTLDFVCEQAKKYRKTPVLTFDQPLFQKATDIIASESPKSQLKKTVLRLGAFHTEMSFLGCIGQLMCGSGLKELLQTVYAWNSVTHMLSGKAVQRALRGHMLVDNALTVLLMECAVLDKSDCYVPSCSKEVACFDQDSSNDDQFLANFFQNDDLQKLAVLYDDLDQVTKSADEINTNESLQNLIHLCEEERLKLSTNRTACLWFQYMDMVSLIQRFIRAERTGDWLLHLDSLQKMLPFFASSGHNLYLKSAYIYLQNMLCLHDTNPEVYNAFKTGQHVIRRSEHNWAGLSTDLVIEQVLMRSLKATGGLTRGRGLSDIQRTKWLLSMPICLQMNSAMQDFSQTVYKTSEQHKETAKARVSRDSKDLNTMLSFLRKRNPFDKTDTKLRNIESGVAAEESANTDCALAIGESIVRGMNGTLQKSFTFKRSLQAVPINEKSLVKLDGEGLQIDTQLLFQRLTTAAERYTENIYSVFQYELSSIPSSLFDNSGLPRAAQKGTLADALWKQCKFDACLQVKNDPSHEIIIDGGCLIHPLPWKTGQTFNDICLSYYHYLKQKYQNHITVVFDGYTHGPDTKDVTHFRRTKGKIGTHVKFSFDTPLRMKKDAFLNNPENKQKFIDMLGECLTSAGVDVLHAQGDADCMIVQTVIKLAERNTTILIGEDTDLLVLLLYHYCTLVSSQIQFKSDSRSAGKDAKLWDIGKARSSLGDMLCKYLPLLHALTGCDTTSRIFGIGKPAALKLFQKRPSFRKLCEDFLASTSLSCVRRYGQSLISALYEGSDSETLDELRYKRFTSKVISSCSSVQVQSLPPTSDAAAFHSLRVFYQTQLWMGNTSLNPLDYGWQIVNEVLLPVKMTLPPAPEKLLQIVRCGCKTGCDSKKCSCRRHGLDCSSACKDCRGISCSNSQTLYDVQESVDDDDI